eukprot:3811305-Rhodomonas_salina.1
MQRVESAVEWYKATAKTAPSVPPYATCSPSQVTWSSWSATPGSSSSARGLAPSLTAAQQSAADSASARTRSCVLQRTCSKGAQTPVCSCFR